jgi:hypothetical protein
MAPITPATSLIRPRTFVKEEWDRFFSDGKANVEGENLISQPTPRLFFFEKLVG